MQGTGRLERMERSLGINLVDRKMRIEQLLLFSDIFLQVFGVDYRTSGAATKAAFSWAEPMLSRSMSPLSAEERAAVHKTIMKDARRSRYSTAG